MYRILYNDLTIFDPYGDDNEVVTDASMDSGENAATYLDFTISVKHPLYNTVAERDGKVRLYWDGELLFDGVIESIDTDIELNKVISCIGPMDYLNDSVVRPYSTIPGEEGLTAPSSVEGLFQWYIDQHNSHVLDQSKSFKVGVNQGASLKKSNHIYASSSSYPTTASEIETKIIDAYGGHLFVRYEDDLRILDLYADVHEMNAQVIDFGLNITDFTKTLDTKDQYTALIPKGGAPEFLNGDLEENFEHWVEHAGASVTTEAVHAGNYAYYIVSGSGTMVNDSFFYLKPGYRYKATVWVRNDRASPVTIHLRYQTNTDGSWKDSQDIGTLEIPVKNADADESEWTEFTVDFLPNAGENVKIRPKWYFTSFGNDSNRKVYVDDFSFTRIDGEDDIAEDPIDLSLIPDGGTSIDSDIAKQGDAIYSVSNSLRYGYKETTYSNDSLTTVDDLLEQSAIELRKQMAPKLTIEVKAVDLSLYMDGYDHLSVGQAVRVRSVPHDVDEYLTVNSISLDLQNPGQTDYMLGTAYDTLTGQQSGYLKSLNAGINHSLDSVTSLDQSVEDKADAAQVALDSYKSTVSTTYATKSEVTQTANSIKSEFSETYTTKEEFNGLEIGGTNLALDSEEQRSVTKGSDSAIVIGSRYLLTEYGKETIKDGSLVSISFEAKATKTGLPVRAYIVNSSYADSSNPGKSQNVTTDWKRYSFAIENITAAPFYAQVTANTATGSSGVTYYVRNFKIEIGSKPTDWSPAPEDMLSTADASATYATKQSVTTVEQTVDGLKSTVSTNYTTLNNKFGSYYTKTEVDQKDSSIKSTVSEVQTTANSALTKATTVEQTADGLEVRLTQAEKDVDTAQTTANAAKKQLYHSANGTSGTAGYVKFAQIKISSAYMNRPIYFALSNRGQMQSNVWVQFLNSASTDPGLSSIKADGSINVYVHKTATSTWEVVAQKSETYDTIYVNDYSNNNGSGCTVSWVNVQVSSVSGFTAATRLAAKRTSSDIDNAAKTATNYLKFDSTGLVVGNHTTTLTGNTQITSSGMNIRNGSTTLASFTANSVELGKNSNSASVELCNGAMSFTRSGSSFGYLNAAVDTFEILANDITFRGNLYVASTAIVNSTLTLNAGMTVNGTTFGATVIGDVFRHGAQLYNSSSGTFGTVTLSSSVTNYNEIVIFPALSDGVRIAAVRLRVSNNTSFDIVSAACGDGWWNLVRGRWTMSGNKLNAVSGANGIMQNGNVWQSGSGIKILRVVAYH